MAAKWDDGVKFLNNLGYDLWFPQDLKDLMGAELFEEIVRQLINERFFRLSKLQKLSGGSLYDDRPLFVSNLLLTAKGRRHALEILHKDKEFIMRFGENPEKDPGSFYGESIDHAAMIAIFKSVAGA